MSANVDYTKYSQHQKILTLMCRFPDKQWWFPYDFMLPEQGQLFVGYEASARLSELGGLYPDMIESERAGKYIRRRVRFEAITEWLPELPKELRYIFHRTGHTKDVKYAEAAKTDARAESKPQKISEPLKADPAPQMTVTAIYRGRAGRYPGVIPNQSYDLAIDRLQIGQPVKLTKPAEITYRDVKAFQAEWKAI